MILDAHALFSDDQDLSQTVATYNSTNVLDFAAAGIDAGAPLRIVIQVTEAFTSGGAATLQVQVAGDAASAAFGAEVILAQTPALALATIAVLGYQIALNVVPSTALRWMRLNYVIGGATTTAGTVTAGIILDNQDGQIST